MRKSEAARYARWSAAVALVFAGLTVGLYLKRGYTRHIERKNAPPSAPVDVERQSSHLTFSKGEGTHKIFTVEASKSIDFKGANASDLEGVKITIFGEAGARHDTMETHTCRYNKDSGDISCAGDVEIILMSADEWKASGGKPGAPGTMKIETKGVSFNRSSGEATTDEAVQFLCRIANVCRGGGGLLIGVDLKKDRPVLEAAYNDSAGVTAEFDLNLLERINRELGADFDLDQWRHRAIYNATGGRIEMYLISEIDQFVHFNEHKFHFRRGEKIVTEFSYKYTPGEFAALAGQAGFEFVRMWSDEAHLFGVFYFVTPTT